MHILVTDVVTCPRCGPEFGLIVLADRIEERHVLEGRLGCANCREEYPVRNGVADLRRVSTTGVRAEAGTAVGRAARGDPEAPYRLAALLGITGPAGPVVISTSDEELVEEVQDHLPDAGVVGLSPEAPPGVGKMGMGWVLSSGPLPFRSRSLGGVALACGDPFPAIEEALRCLARGARLVIDPAPPEVSAALLREGAELLLEQEGVAVAYDPRAG